MPTGYIILCVVVVIVFIGIRIYQKSTRDKLSSEGKIIERDKDFQRQATIFTTRASFNDFLPVLQAYALENDHIRWKTDPPNHLINFSCQSVAQDTSFRAFLKCTKSINEIYEYRFEFNYFRAQKSITTSKQQPIANVLQTTVEKIFYQLDNATTIRREAVHYQATRG